MEALTEYVLNVVPSVVTSIITNLAFGEEICYPEAKLEYHT